MPTKKQKIHVFIDTNVFLSFFAFTNDDVDQLKKLKGEIEKGDLQLYLPRQLVDEFHRNREKKIKETLGQFEKSTLTNVPRLLMGYPAAANYLDAVKNFRKTQNELLENARKDAAAHALPADELFAELSTAAGVIDITESMFTDAVRRKELGNPPGKEASLGDRVAWECLLASVPDGSDLYVVSRDSDYQSPLDAGRPHSFLAHEWASRKHGELRLHTEVKPFLEVHFQLQFASLTEEKDLAVKDLVNAGTFAMTHWALAQLQPYIGLLTEDDKVALARAAIENTQIRWIADDVDVHSFFHVVIVEVLHKFDAETQKELQKYYDAPQQPEDTF